MDAKDLMIGDWIRYNNDTMEVLFNTRVTEVGKDFVKTSKTGGDECFEDEIEPIPITPEILEKNGFEHEENAGYVWDNCRGIIVAYCTFTKRLRIIKDLNILFDTQDFAQVYVHTLQHALRLCGIEKEIEL